MQTLKIHHLILVKGGQGSIYADQAESAFTYSEFGLIGVGICLVASLGAIYFEVNDQPIITTLLLVGLGFAIGYNI